MPHYTILYKPTNHNPVTFYVVYSNHHDPRTALRIGQKRRQHPPNPHQRTRSNARTGQRDGLAIRGVEVPLRFESVEGGVAG